MTRNKLEPYMIAVRNPTPPLCHVCGATLREVATFDATLTEGGAIGELLCHNCYDMLKVAFYRATMKQPDLLYLYNWTSDVQN